MNHLDLFTGIGGFALAARWMGWKTVQFVEIDSYCQKVLKKNFPNTPIHGDIKTFNGEQYRGTIDILTGGFPCQPFSTAGKRKGTEDDRYLWPEKLRVIRAVQPTYIVGENVYGLVNWSNGLVFESVQTSLEAEGYEVAPVILPACGVEAPHRRDRIWFIAYSNISNSTQRRFKQTGCATQSNQDEENKRQRIRPIIERVSEKGVTADSKQFGQQGPGQFERPIDTKEDKTWKASWAYDVSRWPTQPSVCVRDDGVSTRLVRSAISGAGNAIVPQVALQIFKAIHETTRTTPFPG